MKYFSHKVCIKKLRKLWHVIVVFPWKQIDAVQNNCSNNHLQQPGRTFLAFFLSNVYLKCLGSTNNRDQWRYAVKPV